MEKKIKRLQKAVIGDWKWGFEEKKFLRKRGLGRRLLQILLWRMKDSLCHEVTKEHERTIAGITAYDLPIKAAVRPSAQKPQYVLAAKLLNRVPGQGTVDPFEGGRILEHHIRGVLATVEAHLNGERHPR